MNALRRIAPAMVLAVFPLALVGSARGDWPSFVGDGDRTPNKGGWALVDHLDKARVTWEFRRFTTVGKGLYPGTLKETRAMGIEPFYGGANSPIVADGRVFLSYYKPNGQAPAAVRGWRTVADPRAYLPDWFFSVTADDITLAVDARTGKLLWEQVEANKGFNRLGHKRGHWSVSPACADGKVFSFGGAGMLYAYHARSGKKLWETRAVPGMEKQRQAHIEKKQMCWQAGFHRSLNTAAGCVIVPYGGLQAFDMDTGQRSWAIGPVLASHATPVVWRHDGRDHLLVHDGRGTVRLIDAATGKQLWQRDGFGEQIGTVNLTGDVVILNAQSRSPDLSDKANGLFGAFRVSTDGLEKLWTLPDKPGYRHSWTLDRGAERRAAIRDGYVYFTVGRKERSRLVTVELESGRIVSEHPLDATGPYPMADRLMLYADRAHTHPVRVHWFSLADPARPRPLHSVTQFPFRMTTSYETPIQYPFVDGHLFLRTLGGLAAMDLRAMPIGATRRQKITFPELASQPAWDRTVALKATADSGLPVQYVVEDGPAQIVEGHLKFTGQPGIVTVVAHQPGNETWIRADPVRRFVAVGDVAPPVPTDLAAAPCSATRIGLTWKARPGNATGYLIETRRPGGEWAVADRVGPDQRRYVHRQRRPATLYEYRVRSENQVSRSRPSSPARAATYTHTPQIWLEAEAARVGDAWKVVKDRGASAGAYLHAVRNDRLRNVTDDAPPQDVLSYKVHLPVPGQYRLAGHARFGGGGANSFFVRIDGQPWRAWPIQPQSVWSLHRYGTVLFSDLQAGAHTLQVSVRESGTGLDKLWLHQPVHDMQRPTGFGVEASNRQAVGKLASPEQVRVSRGPAGTVLLRWRPVPRARGYIIQQQQDRTWRAIDFIAAPATAWRSPAGASTLGRGPYRIRAWRETVASDPSTAVDAPPED